MKNNHDLWNVEMENFRNGNKLLERQKFAAPADWLRLDQVEGEWNIFRQLVSKKNTEMDGKIPTLVDKVRADEKALN